MVTLKEKTRSEVTRHHLEMALKHLDDADAAEAEGNFKRAKVLRTRFVRSCVSWALLGLKLDADGVPDPASS